MAHQAPCPGSLRACLWLWDWLYLSSQCPQYETLRLPISPSYLWSEAQAEFPPRKDAKKSSLQAVSQTMAPAWQKPYRAAAWSSCSSAAWSSCSSACRHTSTAPAHSKGQRYPGIQPDPALPWLLWGLRRRCAESWWWKSRAEEA